MPASANAAQRPQRDIRRQLVDRVWLGMLVIAMVGAPASISRAFSTGWLHLYTFHALVALVVVAFYAYRRRLSYRVRAAVLMGIFYLIGAIGIVNLGLLGAGLWWLVMSSLLASTLYSQRVGLAIAASALAIVAAAGYGFTTGHLTLPFDANAYATSFTSWLSFLVAASLMPFIVFQAITLFQEATLDLLDEVHRQQAAIERLASHDHLTGLPLLSLAEDRLQMALNEATRAGHRVALLFIDLDGFKSVNDALGHEAGDHVLKCAAARILACMRDVDTVARIGGDEFIVVLNHVAGRDEAAAVAGRAIEAVRAPIELAGRDIAVGGSIGIALFPDDASDAASLRRAADEAMYRAKKAGRNGFVHATSADAVAVP